MELLIFIIYNITMKIKNPYSALSCYYFKKAIIACHYIQNTDYNGFECPAQ